MIDFSKLNYAIVVTSNEHTEARLPKMTRDDAFRIAEEIKETGVAFLVEVSYDGIRELV